MGRFTLAADGVNPNDNSQSINLGAEYGLFQEMLVVRGGYSDLFLTKREKGLTLGFSVNLVTALGMKFSGGYAYQDFQTFDAVNRFSFELKF